jgi:hypothetical protein
MRISCRAPSSVTSRPAFILLICARMMLDDTTRSSDPRKVSTGRFGSGAM